MEAQKRLSFRGVYNTEIDSKGRLYLPNIFQRIIKRSNDHMVIICRGPNFTIRMYNHFEWGVLENDLLSMPETPQTLHVKRILYSTLTDSVLDSMGRISLSATQLEISGIEKKATLVGLINAVEIWEPLKFAEYASNVDKGENSKTQNNDIDLFYEEKERKDVFLCYSNKDKQFVKKLAEDLRLRYVNVWYDKWEILPGDSISERIEEGIEKSAWFAIILSPDSVRSKWCQRELRRALSAEFERERLSIIPIICKECEIPGFLKDIARVDLSNDETYESQFDYLMRRFC